MNQPLSLDLELISMHFSRSYALCAKFVNHLLGQLAPFNLLFQAQADVQHLWFGRRASTRIRSQLMAAIYDKALKRKDFSGIVDKDNSKKASDGIGKSKKASAAAKAKADDPRPGADIGKIVNLMAGDANRVAMTTSAMYLIYGSMSLHFSCKTTLIVVALKAHSNSLLPVSSYTSKLLNRVLHTF